MADLLVVVSIGSALSLEMRAGDKETLRANPSLKPGFLRACAPRVSAGTEFPRQETGQENAAQRRSCPDTQCGCAIFARRASEAMISWHLRGCTHTDERTTPQTLAGKSLDAGKIKAPAES